MIVVVDYGMGNLKSVLKAVEYLGYEGIISDNALDIQAADKLILPGVGAFPDAMKNLIKLDLKNLLTQEVMKKGKPVLGICLGAQLIAKESFEGGRTQGLGWVEAIVKPFNHNDHSMKSIHTGWNNVKFRKSSSLLTNIKDNTAFYFVHGYYLDCADDSIVLTTSQYGNQFASSLQVENIYATQFHPEKSQKAGLTLLENFLEV
jgi:glutamine amidotransferase